MKQLYRLWQNLKMFLPLLLFGLFGLGLNGCTKSFLNPQNENIMNNKEYGLLTLEGFEEIAKKELKTDRVRVNEKVKVQKIKFSYFSGFTTVNIYDVLKEYDDRMYYVAMARITGKCTAYNYNATDYYVGGTLMSKNKCQQIVTDSEGQTISDDESVSLYYCDTELVQGVEEFQIYNLEKRDILSRSFQFQTNSDGALMGQTYTAQCEFYVEVMYLEATAL